MKRLFAALLACCLFALPCGARAAAPSPGLVIPVTPDARTGHYRVTVSDTEIATASSVTRSVERTGLTAKTDVSVAYPLDVEHPQTYYVTVTALPEADRVGLDSPASKTASVVTGCCKGVEGAFILGSGSAADPYQVYTPAQFRHVEQHLNAQFIQKRDIALTGAWTPLGTLSGVYDGGRYSITGLDTTSGLFLSVSGQSATAPAVVRNVRLINPKAQSGTIAGKVIFGTISNCSVTGASVYYSSGGTEIPVGGLVMAAENAKIERCTVTGIVGGESGFAIYIGGIVGHNDDSIYTDCLSSVQFNITSSLSCVGGISGATAGHTSPITLQNCHWTNPAYAVGRDPAFGGDFTPNTGESFGNSQVPSIDGLS